MSLNSLPVISPLAPKSRFCFLSGNRGQWVHSNATMLANSKCFIRA